MNVAATIIALYVCAVSVTAAQDSARTYSASDVIVHADPITQPWRLDRPISTSASVDELMRLGGLTLVQRANGFAGEVAMMGLRGAQLSRTIDGMKIHAACVDNMDPSTAYIEVDNVSSMHVDADGSDMRYGQTLGGSVNFKLRQPRYATPLQSTIDGTLESNAAVRRLHLELGGGTNDVSFRTGYTVREVRNMVAGNGAELSLSGYAKQNLHVAAGWKPNATGEVEGMVIVDHVSNVGYPALLMDTRRADALIGALTWRERWTSAVKTSIKLYANTVDHLMDDLDRPTTEIMQRRFMPGMYMPMQGRSSVIGVLAETAITTTETVIGITLDATALQAAATMDMLPIDTAVAPMTMTNIGSAGVDNIGLACSLDHAIDCYLSVQASARIDAAWRTIHDTLFRSVLSGYYPGSAIASHAVVPAVSLGATIEATDAMQLAVVLGYAERLPTHLELFGFMIYDPQANIVTNGNPDLRRERALSGTMQCNVRSQDIRLTGSMYVRYIDDYIAPQPSTKPEEAQPPSTRSIMNIGLALLAGFDLTAAVPMTSWCTLQATLRGCRGQSLTWDDPLPLIAPLTLHGRLIIGDPILQVELQVLAAMAQDRASQRVLSEDRTPGWWTASAVVGWQISSMIRAQCSATNIMDAFYHEHTSINNMPARGRSMNLGVRVAL